jgi:hypothetical protein
MGFPLCLLVSRQSWEDGKHLFRSVEDRVVFWAPADSVYRFVRVDYLRSQSSSS